MKKLCILLIITMSAFAYGKELNSFPEISNALMQGNSIRLIIHLDHDDPEKSPLSFFTDACTVVLRSTYLQFANTHFTTNHPGLEKMPLLENTTYRISENGEVCILSRFITLPDYQIKNEHSINCILGQSAKVYTND